MSKKRIDDYAKHGRLGEGLLLCSFYHESSRTWIKTTVNKFAISNHTALILGVHALRSYLKLIYEYEPHSLSNKKVSGAKDHGKNCIKVKPPLVCQAIKVTHFLVTGEHKKVFLVIFLTNIFEFYRASHKKVSVGPTQGFNSQFWTLLGFSISVSFLWCII